MSRVYIFILNLEMLDLYLFTCFSFSGLKQEFSTLTTYRSQLENTDARAAFDASCIRISGDKAPALAF